MGLVLNFIAIDCNKIINRYIIYIMY